jgi:hypothetical protein
MSDQAFDMLIPIRHCCGGKSWVVVESCIEAEASQSTQYADWKLESKEKLSEYKRTWQTLIAMVWIAEMTSSSPPSMQLSGNERLYSHITEVISIVAIFVMWPIMATLVMSTTWPKHLIEWTGKLLPFQIRE